MRYLLPGIKFAEVSQPRNTKLRRSCALTPQFSRFVEDAFVRSNPVAAFAELKAKADDIFGGERSPSLVHRLYERCCFFADIIPARFYARYWKLLLRIVMTFESDLFSNDIANPLATGWAPLSLPRSYLTQMSHSRVINFVCLTFAAFAALLVSFG
jgi:hypothetical protein